MDNRIAVRILFRKSSPIDSLLNPIEESNRNNSYYIHLSPFNTTYTRHVK